MVFYCFFLTRDVFAKISEDVSSQSQEIRKLIQQSEDFFDAALYHEAIPLYQEILRFIEKKPTSSILDQDQIDKIEAKIRFRYAQVLFQLKDYKAAITLLKKPQISIDHQFLLGTAYRNNGEYDQAIAIFQTLHNNYEVSTHHREEVEFELALSLYLKGDFSQAQKAFENVLFETQSQRLQILSNFYLTRIAINLGHLIHAENYLNQADHLITSDELLKYESAFLRGKIYYKKQDFENAVFYFEKAIPKEFSNFIVKVYSDSAASTKIDKSIMWLEDTLYYIGNSYLKMADTSAISNEKRLENFSKAQQTLAKLVEIRPQEERSWLSLGECYLAMGKYLKDEKVIKSAEEIFSDPSKFTSQNAQNQALLLKAKAHPDYVERDRRFRQLTHQSNANSSFFAMSWYFRGLNDFEEGCSLEHSQKGDEAHKIFERAAVSFERASELLQVDQPSLGAKAMLLQARAYNAQISEKNRLKAMNILHKLWEEDNKLLLALPDPLEAHLLYSEIVANLSDEVSSSAIIKLQQGIVLFPKSQNCPLALNMLGTLFYKNGDYECAEEAFCQLAQDWPQSHLAAEALFRASQSVEKLKKDRDSVRIYKQKILDHYPSAPIAAEAYFTLFSYHEYLQGDRLVIKHLNAFPKLYPDSPLVLNAWFLIGLDNKRDRRSPEGKWLRKKNLTLAIDNFLAVETCFETLNLRGKIPDVLMEHYLLIRYKAYLERGLANYTLANESTKAKKQIYLEYAQETFLQLLQDLRVPDDRYKKWLLNKDHFWHLEEESSYWLAQVYIAANEPNEAEKNLFNILEKYKTAKITKGYFLSRIWSTLGSIALDRQEYAVALDYFLQAEDASKGKLLSTDQRLDLLIQQSMCLKALKQPENAILILSKVINDDAVSSLRVKAMFLRAGIYESQERFELARKQLETTSKKGGEWALKAKEKLENEYGYR